MAGCFIFGFFYAMAEQRLSWQGDLRVIVLAGFVGSFTTFSTFAYQTNVLLRDSQYVLAAVNVMGQNVLGLVFVLLGLVLGKYV